MWTALQAQSTGGTDRHTKSTTHAAIKFRYTDFLRHRECPKLAVLNAVATTSAHVGIHSRPKIRMGHRGEIAELSHASLYGTRAGAAVADVEDPVAVVASGVH